MSHTPLRPKEKGTNISSIIVPSNVFTPVLHIQVEIHHARSIIEVFDAVSYEKGSSVIRMLQGYLGDVTFQVTN